MNLLNNVDNNTVSKSLSVKTDEIGQSKEVSSDIQNNISRPNIKKINSAADILSLGLGAQFSLLTEFNGESNIITLEVFDVAQNTKFTQIQGKGPNDSVAVITLTPSLTNILLKTSNNIFEYTGPDFQGILDQVARLNLSDDVRETRSFGRRIQDDFKPKKMPE